MFSSLAKPAVVGNEINVSLGLAMLNLEAYLSEEAGARDMATDHGFVRLLDAKVERFTGGAIAQESFSHLVTIEKLPDISRAIASGEVSLDAAWKFRNTRKAIQFREKHRSIFNAVTKKYRGKILQYYGDGTLSIFSSAIDAVKCAIEMQLGFQEDPVIPIRIGIHRGPVTRITNDEPGQAHLRWSPDGTRLVFSVSESQSRLWRVSAEGGTRTPLTSDHDNVASPVVSPDGRQVAFLSDKFGARDVYVVAATGGPSRRLTTDPGGTAAAQWSPDGMYLVFESSRGGNSDLWIVPSAGGEPRQVTTHPARDVGPVWSPDGRSLAFLSTRDSGTSDVWVIAAEGGEARRLTREGATRPRWGPDGEDLVYLSSAGTDAQVQIWMVSVATGATARLTDGGYKAQAEFAPDGTAVAYQEHDGIGFDIYVTPAGGGAATRLTVDSGDDVSPRWSPDGSLIAFLSGTSGDRGLWVMPAARGDRTRVTVSEGQSSLASSAFCK